MAKFYRVTQDTFLWEKGAILTDEKNSSGYSPINDLWNKLEKQDEYISTQLVEKNPDWFERVYPVDLLTKTVYKLKDAAREHFAKQHTE